MKTSNWRPSWTVATANQRAALRKILEFFCLGENSEKFQEFFKKAKRKVILPECITSAVRCYELMRDFET